MIYLLAIVLSYLIGSISGSFILGKIMKGLDIREHGSKNAGTTNAMRVMGRKVGLYTFFIDFAKGIVCMLLMKQLLPWDTILIAAIACVLGHDFPFYMNFRGGKGVATTLGTLAVYNFKLGIIAVIVAILVAAISRYVSLGSITFFVLNPIIFYLLGVESSVNMCCLILLSILGILRHKSNITRLLTKSENKIGGRKTE